MNTSQLLGLNFYGNYSIFLDRIRKWFTAVGFRYAATVGNLVSWEVCSRHLCQSIVMEI